MEPADYPPVLQWETVVWELYALVDTQWRVGANGRVIGLDFNPAIALMQSWHWPLDLGLALLKAVAAEITNTTEPAAE